MKAFILGAGLGTRLRPFTHGLPKATMPFLNLPLICYGWFYLEQMGVSQFVLNSYLFPERLKKEVKRLATPKQKISFVVEEKLLDSGAGFYNVKNHFEKEAEFFYLNGDSLFFPSDLNLLKKFKEDFIKSSFLFSFFGIAKDSKEIKKEEGYLWIDRDFILRGIGSEGEMLSKGFLVKRSQNLTQGELRPVQFSGLALCRSEFLKSLSKDKPHIFWDVMNPLLKEGRYKVFVDEKGILLEGGSKSALLQASQLCLESLFSKFQQKKAWQKEIKKILEKVFSRFDPEDKQVGYQFGKTLSEKLGAFVLASSSIQGLENLKVEEFAVLGSGVSFVGKSFLKRSVLDCKICWRGSLTDEILIKSKL